MAKQIPKKKLTPKAILKNRSVRVISPPNILQLYPSLIDVSNSSLNQSNFDTYFYFASQSLSNLIEIESIAFHFFHGNAKPLDPSLYYSNKIPVKKSDYHEII